MNKEQIKKLEKDLCELETPYSIQTMNMLTDKLQMLKAIDRSV